MRCAERNANKKTSEHICSLVSSIESLTQLIVGCPTERWVGSGLNGQPEQRVINGFRSFNGALL